jgi:hypothetical protein
VITFLGVSEESAGEKAAGLRRLEREGLPIPLTYVYGDTLPTVLPERLGPVVVVRSSVLGRKYDDPRSAEAISGAFKSIKLHRSEYDIEKAQIARLLRSCTLVVQPYLDHLSGALCHIWTNEYLARIAVGTSIEALCQGASADVEVRMSLRSGDLVTTGEQLTSSQRQILLGIARRRRALSRLHLGGCAEIETCLTMSGHVAFLQLQACTATVKGWGTA